MRPLLGFAVLCVLIPVLSEAQTQDWTSVQALPRETRVIVRELGGRGGTVRGRFVLANDSEMTVLKDGRPVVIPKTTIARIDRVRRDPVWRGVLFGALWALVARPTIAAEACIGKSEPGCTLNGVAVMSGVGALIDLSINDKRTVYIAP